VQWTRAPTSAASIDTCLPRIDDRHELVERLGQSGIALVYRARQVAPFTLSAPSDRKG
jgi:hypothetical protein